MHKLKKYFQHTTVILAKIYVQITKKITLQSWNPLNCENNHIKLNAIKLTRPDYKELKHFVTETH